MIAKEVKEKLRAVVGAEHCIETTHECFGYSYDSSFIPMSTQNIPPLVLQAQAGRFHAWAGIEAHGKTPQVGVHGPTRASWRRSW